MESVALVPKCVECEARWLLADRERWRAYLGVEEDLDEPAEVVLFCPTCAEREFGGCSWQAPVGSSGASLTLDARLGS